MDAEKLLKAIRDYYDESIFVTDGNGVVVYANQVAAERLGADLDSLIGKNVRDLVADGMYSKSTTLEAIRTKRPSYGQINDNGEMITYSNSVPVLDEEGNVSLVVTNNMSLERKAQWDLVISRAQSENERLRLERDYLRLQDQRVIIADSGIMKRILEMVAWVAPMDSNVVISGESGTGKDLIARLIHEKSHRSENAFLSVNCAAMPEQLLESELFGYEGGAFTGALSKGKIGLFEATSGGTLFLDEVGEMSLALQSKLLRVLENHEVRRVGGLTNIPVDVRVICATNRDLAEMVKEKTFREDLYYRLSVFNIDLPPLRDRSEDIIPIAELFLHGLNEKYGKNKRFPDVTKETMLSYSWPGNIRELRNVVERIFVINSGDELGFTPAPRARIGENGTGLSYFDIGAYSDFRSYMEDAERKYIDYALEKCGGSVAAAAAMLGLHRSALYRKLGKK